MLSLGSAGFEREAVKALPSRLPVRQASPGDRVWGCLEPHHSTLTRAKIVRLKIDVRVGPRPKAPWRSSPELRTRRRPAIGGSGWGRSSRGRTPVEPADTLRLASQAWTLAQIETLLRRRFHKACRSRRSRRDCTGTASATKSPPAARRGSRNARKASEMTAPTRSGALTPAYGALGSPPRRLPFPGIERSLSGLHRPRRPSGLTAGLPFIEYPAWMGSAEVRQVRVPVHSCQ